MIRLKVYANLRKEFGLNSGFVVDFNNNDKDISIKEILEYYKVDLDKISIVLVNGKPCDFNRIVKNGDTVAFFSPVAGG
jgi:molybdopterin converting factor small subunit